MNPLFIAIFPVILIANNYEFGPSIIVNDDPPGTHGHATIQRAIGCRGDTVYLVWGDNRYGNPIYNNSRVFFSKSTDAGNTWSANLLISQDIDNYPCAIPHVCLDALGNIYVAYWGQDGNNNNSDIYFVKSTDGGTSFTSPVLVNDSVEVHHQVYPACAVDSAGQNVYVVWEDCRNTQYEPDIYFARSIDGGVSFLPSIRVNDDSDTANRWYPVIACDNSGQNVYVAWMDQRDTLHGWDVYFSRSTDFGQTFGPNYAVNDTGTSGNSSQRKPSIYWQNSVVYLAWDDLQPDSGGIYVDKSTDNGTSFGVDVCVVDTNNVSAYPSIAVNDSGKVVVVWEDGREYSTYGGDIYLAFSDDGGLSFESDVLVNDHLGTIDAWDSDATVCVNSAGDVFVAWDSDRNDASHTNQDIYFAAGDYVGIQEYYEAKPAIILSCYPNPFSRLIYISFGEVHEVESVELKIFDVSGRVVKRFARTIIGLSDHIVWDGRDTQGHQVPCGIYFVELSNGEKREIKKAVKVK